VLRLEPEKLSYVSHVMRLGSSACSELDAAISTRGMTTVNAFTGAASAVPTTAMSTKAAAFNPAIDLLIVAPPLVR
jgi:hypothetical protein